MTPPSRELQALCAFACGSDCIPSRSARLQAHELERLVGCFDMDPNRVLDLVIGAAAAVREPGPLLALLPHFSAEARTHVLGFRFQAHAGEGAAPTPPALFRVAAAAVQARTALPFALQLSRMCICQTGTRWSRICACPAVAPDLALRDKDES